MIELKLKDLDTPSGETLVTYSIEGLTTDDILTIGDIGYSTTFKNSKVKLELEETDSLELFAVYTYEDELGDPIPENKLYTDIYLDIFETADLIYIGRAKGNLTENPDSLLKRFNKWLNSKKAVTEDLDESTEDSAWGEEEVRAELIRLTNNFKKNEGEITTYYEEEKDHMKNILDAAGYQVEVSDGRKDKNSEMSWVVTYVKKVNESLTEVFSTQDVNQILSSIDNKEKEILINTIKSEFGQEDANLLSDVLNSKDKSTAFFDLLDTVVRDRVLELAQDNGMDYGCDKCGERVPEDRIHWFYGAEVGLCDDCYDKMTDEECYQLDDGNFSSLAEANKTKAQRHNDMMNKIFDNAKKQNQKMMNILKANGVSEEEIKELEKNTGLHGSALHQKIIDMGL